MTAAKLKLCSGRETVRKFERTGWMVARHPEHVNENETLS